MNERLISWKQLQNICIKNVYGLECSAVVTKTQKCKNRTECPVWEKLKPERTQEQPITIQGEKYEPIGVMKINKPAQEKEPSHE